MNCEGEGIEQTPPPNVANEADSPQLCKTGQPTEGSGNSPFTASTPPHPPESQSDATDPAYFTEKWALNVFRQVEEKLAENITAQIQLLPLFFLKTPSRAGTFDDSALTLDESVPSNSLVVSHEHWLGHHRRLFEKFVQAYQSDPRLLLQVTTITRKLEKEVVLLNKVKKSEWKRQLAAMTEAGDQLVDSRE